MTYKCISCQKEQFSSPVEYKDHLEVCGAGKRTAAELDAMVKISEEPVTLKPGVNCPFCHHFLHSVRHYRCNVGRHQEQLALFALSPPEAVSDSDSRAVKSDTLVTGNRFEEDKKEYLHRWLGKDV